MKFKTTFFLQDEELGEISENIAFLYGGFQTRTGEQVRYNYISLIYHLYDNFLNNVAKLAASSWCVG